MRTTAIVILISLVLLTGCQTQTAPVYHTGSDGLTLTFGQNMPPKSVYEDSTVPLLVTLANKGAWDINYTDIVFSIKGDPFYVNITQDGNYPFASATGDYGPSQSPDQTVLHGKSPGWENGDFIDLQPIAEFNPIPGLREQPTTQLFASVCYAYGTVLGASVCVDANAFNGNVQKQVCGAETATFKDQGAPVAITSIENRPSPARVQANGGTPSRDMVQPVFIIHIQNVGGGTVLMPSAASRTDFLTACSRGVTGNPAVSINATLGALQLVCKPSPVLLRSDEGYTTCVLPTTASGLVTPNYLSTFRAELHYIYRTSLSTDVNIQRSPAAAYTNNSAYNGQDANSAFIGGQTRCEFCSGNRNDPQCNGWPAQANQTARYTCACSEQTCQQLAQKTPGACVFGQSWCPGTSYCCITSQ